MNEITLSANTKQFAALQIGDLKQNPVLMLHGWLDNAASFHPLLGMLRAPNIIALDMLGHGHSSHRPESSDYNLVDYVQDLYELIHAYNWSSVTFVGHSLGAIVSSIFCACFPELVSKFVCIEALGPLSEPEETTVKQLKASIMSRFEAKTKSIRQPESLHALVNSRMKVSDLSHTNAALIMRRNVSDDKAGGIVWNTDMRLRTKSSMRFTEAQAREVIRSINCKVCLILGQQGFEKVKRNFDKRMHLFKNLQTHHVQGGHHVHMDSPNEVASIIQGFLDT